MLHPERNTHLTFTVLYCAQVDEIKSAVPRVSERRIDLSTFGQFLNRLCNKLTSCSLKRL